MPRSRKPQPREAQQGHCFCGSRQTGLARTGPLSLLRGHSCRAGGSCRPGRCVQQVTGVRSAPGEALPRPLSVSHTVTEAPGAHLLASLRGTCLLPSSLLSVLLSLQVYSGLCPASRLSRHEDSRGHPGPGSGAGRTGRRASWPHVSAGGFKRRDGAGRPSHTRQVAPTRCSCQAAPRPPHEPCRRCLAKRGSGTPEAGKGEGKSGRGGLADAQQQV